MAAGDKAERVAVRRSLGDRIGGDVSTGAGLGLDDDGLAEISDSPSATMRDNVSAAPPGAKP